MIRRPLNPVSKKMKIQKTAENKLKQQMLAFCGYKCEVCRKAEGKLDKHEIQSRAQLGDPLDPLNCIILCRECHNAVHRLLPKELTAENLYAIAKDRQARGFKWLQ